MRLLQALYSFIRCPLNHRWQLLRADAEVIEHRCARCGKHTVRRM